MTSRRAFVAGGAGATLLTALGYRAWDRGVFSSGKGDAFAPWQEWQGHAGEGVRRPLHAAILAANAHDTQPWLFELHEDSITVYADLSRNIGAADPFRRELYVSLGCAMQNVALVRGFNAGRPSSERLVSNPGREPVKVIDLALQPDLKQPPNVELFTEMLNAIPRRHTNRGPYLANRPVTAQGLHDVFFEAEQGINQVLVVDAGARRELGALIVEATERFISDKEMAADSAGWFRTGRREILDHRDGVTTDTAGLSPLMTVAAKLMPDVSAASADQYWLAATRDVQVPTSPAYGIIFAKDRLAVHQTLETGSSWQRSHLLFTSRGLAAQPLNQPIEMMDRDEVLGRKNEYAKELRKIAGVAEGDPAFVFRLGYAERPALPSPRRPLEDVIRKTGFA